MALFKLTSRAYTRLREIARSSTNARQVRRAQALLWLHEKHTANAVAQRLGMSWRAFNAGRGSIKIKCKTLCWSGSKKDNTRVACLSN
jgi:hypothetical protein